MPAGAEVFYWACIARGASVLFKLIGDVFAALLVVPFAGSAQCFPMRTGIGIGFLVVLEVLDEVLRLCAFLVGIYLRNNYFVHASSSQGVMISNLNDDYWASYYAGAGSIDVDAYTGNF